MPARSYSRVAPVGFSLSTPRAAVDLAALREAAEALVQQREPEPAPAPGGPHRQRADPAPVTQALVVVERDGGDLVTVPDDRDELGVEPRPSEDRSTASRRTACGRWPHSLTNASSTAAWTAGPWAAGSNGRSSSPAGNVGRGSDAPSEPHHPEERPHAHVTPAREELRAPVRRRRDARSRGRHAARERGPARSLAHVSRPHRAA